MPTPAPALASIVVPAHDEEAVIGRCLSGLLAGARPGELEVVVVANGCTDRTAEVARSFGPDVVVRELETGSKPAALNAGDAAVTTLPRLYVDADVETSTEAVRAVVAALDRDEPLVATPRRDLQLATASVLTRLYYRTWEALQEARGEIIGTGVYALNAAGRERFGRFPDRVGDDTFVHALFGRDERRVVGHSVRVWVPGRLREVVAVRARVHLGNLTVDVRSSDRPSKPAQLATLARRPAALAGLPVYVLVTLAAKRRAQRRLAAGDLAWTRAQRTSG